MRALLEYEVIDLIPFFIQTMEEDEDEEIRALAAANLGKYIYLGEVDNIPRIKHKEIEESLLRVAHGSDTALVRRKAVEALAYSSHQDIPGLIQAAYQSGQPEWVASALYAMGRTVDLRWEPQIKAMLHSPIHEILFEAIRAAGELELASARSILIEYLDESDREIRMAAVWALARIGGENIQALLIELLEQAEEEEDIQIIEDAIDHLAFYQELDSLDDFDLA
jgi:HEAT repeat protein